MIFMIVEVDPGLILVFEMQLEAGATPELFRPGREYQPLGVDRGGLGQI
jgi:hypothetical protein